MWNLAQALAGFNGPPVPEATLLRQGMMIMSHEVDNKFVRLEMWFAYNMRI